MGFTSRKGISNKSLFSVIICLWLHGNNGEAESGFEIYRGERFNVIYLQIWIMMKLVAQQVEVAHL
jgi:hypothetical protein